jgi:hypothetical protein
VRFEPISAGVTRKPLIDLSFVFKAVDVLYFRPRAVSMDLPIAVGDLLGTKMTPVFSMSAICVFPPAALN